MCFNKIWIVILLLLMTSNISWANIEDTTYIKIKDSLKTINAEIDSLKIDITTLSKRTINIESQIDSLSKKISFSNSVFDAINLVALVAALLAFSFTIGAGILSFRSYSELKSIKAENKETISDIKINNDNVINLIKERMNKQTKENEKDLEILTKENKELLSKIRQQTDLLMNEIDLHNNTYASTNKIHFATEHKILIERIRVFEETLKMVTNELDIENKMEIIEEILEEWYNKEFRTIEYYNRLKNLYNPDRHQRKTSIAYFKEQGDKTILKELEKLREREEDIKVRELLVSAITTLQIKFGKTDG